MQPSKNHSDSINNQLQYFHILCSLYVGIVLISITQTSRLIPIKIPIIHYEILITGGTLSIPFAFFIQNIVTEVYGYTKSRGLVQLSLIIIGGCIFYEYALTFIPTPTVTVSLQNSYNDVFASIPKHALAFILSCFTGSVINNYIISKSKIWFQGKYLRLRFICATAVGEAVYMAFGIIVWLRYLELRELLPLILISYFYRIAFEGATLPLSYHLSSFLKKS